MKDDATFHDRLLRGEIVETGGKLYGVCQQCGGIVRVNKPFLGDLHLCTPDTKGEE